METNGVTIAARNGEVALLWYPRSRSCCRYRVDNESEMHRTLIIDIIKRYTNLRPEEDIAIWYVQVGAELAATMSALLLQFLLVGHGCPSDIVGVLADMSIEKITGCL